MDTENFTEALRLTHSFDPNVSSRQRLQAEQYLMELRERPEGLNLSFHIIANESVNEIRCFWAFNTIIHHLPSIALAVDAAQAEELYHTLFSFIYRYFFSSPSLVPADYLFNKHAQVMVVGLHEFYPARWSAFFNDLFDLLSRSASHPPTADAVAVYFLRIFEYVDERVAAVRERTDRGKEQRARDMAVKDAMREAVIPRAVSVWYSTLCESRVRAPEVSRLCLSVVQSYAEWIDAALLMTPEWINMLYYLMTVSQLRVAACECMLSLIEKKQLPGTKMESLRTLNVVDALPRIVAMLGVPPSSDDDIAFIDVVAKLVVSAAEQFLALLESCSAALGGGGGGSGLSAALISAVTVSAGNGGGGGVNRGVVFSESGSDVASPTSSATGGASSSVIANVVVTSGDGLLTVQDRPFEITPALLDGLSGAVHCIFTQVLSLFRIDSNEMRDVVLPFAQTYAKSPTLQEEEAAEMLLLIFAQTRISHLAQQPQRIWEDEVTDQRKGLHNLVRLLYRRFPELVLQHLRQLVWCATTCGGRTVNDVGGKPLSEGGNNSSSNNADGSSGTGAGQLPPIVIGNAPSETFFAAAVAGEDWSDASNVEGVLRYVYEMGEAIRMDCLKDESDPITLLFSHVLSADVIVANPCPCVHLTFFEVMERYSIFFVYHRGSIGVLLQRLLLLPCGVLNRDDRVRARVCGLFSRLVQVLKSSLGEFLPDMVSVLQTIVFTADQLQPSDRRELYEALGTLLGMLCAAHDGRSGAEMNDFGGGDAAAAAARAAGSMRSGDLLSLAAGSGFNPASMNSSTGDPLTYSSTSAAGCSSSSPLLQSAACAGEAVRLVQQVTQTAVEHMLRVSASDTSTGEDGGRRGESVADAISYLSALAKGIGGAATSSSSSSSASSTTASASTPAANTAATGGQADAVGSNGSAAATSIASGATSAGAATLQHLPPAALYVARLFADVTEHVMRVMTAWRASTAVRDGVGQFFQQMVNTVPYELLGSFFEQYVDDSLQWMEAVPELSKLLRLVFQFVNKAGARGVLSVARLTPLIWKKIGDVGALSAASPVVWMGVISENAREKVDVYRQFFTYVFSIAQWGCAAAVLLLPTDMTRAMLEQLLYAVTLPADLELPKAALQTFTKIVLECCSAPTGAAAAEWYAVDAARRQGTGLSGNHATSSPHSAGGNGGGGNHPLHDPSLSASSNNTSFGSGVVSLCGGGGVVVDEASRAAGIAVAERAAVLLHQYVVEEVIPTSLRTLLSPSFDLKDAKNFIVVGEVGQLCKAAAGRFGESALQSMYTVLAPYAGEQEAMGFCLAVRDDPRFTGAHKLRFRNLLERAQVAQQQPTR